MGKETYQSGFRDRNQTSASRPDAGREEVRGDDPQIRNEKVELIEALSTIGSVCLSFFVGLLGSQLRDRIGPEDSEGLCEGGTRPHYISRIQDIHFGPSLKWYRGGLRQYQGPVFSLGSTFSFCRTARRIEI